MIKQSMKSLVPQLHSRPFASRRFDDMASDMQHTRRLSINPSIERITTIIAAGAKVAGDLSLAEGVKLDGDMRGNLVFGLEDGLGIISKKATLQGDLRGPKALIMGTIEGDIYVQGLVMLAPTAMVLGNVYYDRLIVRDGAQISGTMRVNTTRALMNVVDVEAIEEGAVRDGVVQSIRSLKQAQPS